MDVDILKLVDSFQIENCTAVICSLSTLNITKKQVDEIIKKRPVITVMFQTPDKNRNFWLKIVVPPNHPSILGYPYFWKHPYYWAWKFSYPKKQHRPIRGSSKNEKPTPQSSCTEILGEGSSLNKWTFNFVSTTLIPPKYGLWNEVLLQKQYLNSLSAAYLRFLTVQLKNHHLKNKKTYVDYPSL